jgi:Tfp pilus assembly protein PilF
MFPKAIVLLLALITGTAVTCGSVPIIVSRGAGRRTTGNLVNTAESQLKMGDLAGAKRNVGAALQIDPEFWPALYTRAKISPSRANMSSPFRIVTKRSGNIGDLWKPRCCAPV